MTGDQEAGNSSDRVWDVLLKISIPAIIALAGAVIAHEVRLTKMESNQFTSVEAREFEIRMDKNHPEWLKQDVRDIKVMLQTVTVSFSSLDKRLTILEEILKRK